MPKSNDLISIILPTYNGSRYIKQSIDSCLNQTHENLELIIVNDGSTDETHQLMALLEDSRINYVVNDKNIGLPSSLNKGFSLAKGQYLTWMSDDNYYEQDALEYMLTALKQQPKIDFVYAPYSMVDEDGKFLRNGKVKDPSELDYDNYIGLCFLFTRKVYETVGEFNPDTFLAEDYEYWLRVREKFRMKKLDKFLYYYRIHPGTLTSIYTEKKVQMQVEKVRERFISRGKSLYFKARKAFYQNDLDQTRKNIRQSVMRDPLNYEAWRLYFIAHMPKQFVSLVRTMKQKIKG